MPVINLGGFGQPRKSSLSGLSKMLGGIAESRIDARSAAATEEGKNKRAEATEAGLESRSERTAKTNKYTADLQLKGKLAQLEATKAEGVRKHMKTIHTQLSDMDDDKFNLFKETPGGKQLIKMVGKNLPEFVDQNGELIRVSSKDQLVQKLEDKQNTLLLQIQEKGPQSITKNDRAFLEVLDKAGPNVVADVQKSLAQSDLFVHKLQTNPAEAAKMVANALKLTGQFGGQTGLSTIPNEEGSATGGGSPEFNVDKFLQGFE